MPVYIPVDVELNPYLKKFVDHYYAKRNYVVDKRDVLGMSIIGSLRKIPRGYKPSLEKQNLVTFQVEDHLRTGRGKYIPEKYQKEIRHQIKSLFDLNLYTTITLFLAKPGSTVTQAIDYFCSVFSLFPEEIDADSLRKNFYRLRISSNNRIMRDIHENNEFSDYKKLVIDTKLKGKPLKTSEIRENNMVCPLFSEMFNQLMIR